MDTHGIAEVYYNNFPEGLIPTLECLSSIALSATTWQEAGAALDRHLEETRSES